MLETIETEGKSLNDYIDILDARPAGYLEKMGFNSLTEADFINRSTALGGLTNGVTVEENTNAFSTFANNGQFIDAYIIDNEALV